MLLGTELYPHLAKSDGLSRDLRASLFWGSHRGRPLWPPLTGCMARRPGPKLEALFLVWGT